MNKVQKILSGELDHVILTGHALEVLKSLPDQCVQCSITSPPYFGARNYESQWKLWGGDSNCEHEWQQTPPRRLRTSKDVKNPETMQNSNKGSNCDLPETRSCLKCGGWFGELGLEPDPDLFVSHLVMIFREVKRVLRDDGTCFINIGDSYTGYHGNSRVPDAEAPSNKPGYVENMRDSTVGVGNLKEKELMGVPWRLAFALQNDGWYLRSEIIWRKKNCNPESVKDRPTRSHEQIFLLTKKPHYYYDQDAIREPHSEVSLKRIESPFHLSADVDGRAVNTPKNGDMKRFCHPAGANKRDVWSFATANNKEEHFAVFPHDLPFTCLLAGTSAKGACIKCGAPYKRLVEYTSIESFELSPDDPRYRPERYKNEYDLLKGEEGTGMRFTEVKELGWEATCKCNAGIRPCIVLDPFSGLATTGLAAIRNGRSYIGTEINPKYVELSEKRLQGKEPLLQLIGELHEAKNKENAK